MSSKMSETKRETKIKHVYNPSQFAKANTHTYRIDTQGCRGTHPAAQAVAPFASDFPLLGLGQQPGPAARPGAQHAPHLQHALLGAVLLVPVVL